MPPEYNPAASIKKTASYSLQQITDLFAAKRMSELARSPVFDQIFESVLLSKVTTIPKLKAVFPSIKSSRSLGTGLDHQTRVELLKTFQQAIKEKPAEKPSGNKPPSQPEQYAQPEAGPKLPDWLRKAEAHLSR